MSEPEQSIIFPDVTIVSSNTTDYRVCGNPDLVERVDIQTKSPGVQTVVYGYVDSTTNTYVHSHEMEVKRGSFL
jgi:hypothetical protein